MNLYVLPGHGIYGGIKVGFQFASILATMGVRIAVATPGGLAPTWFESSMAVVDRDSSIAQLTEQDVAIFSLPHDYALLKRTPARLVFHCQGTDPLIDPIVDDPNVVMLACWPQAAACMRARGREPIDVGIHVSDVFHYDGTPKKPAHVAYMPRRGSDLAEACRRHVPSLTFVPIDNQHERDAARIMKDCAYFLATSEGEWFGLPALEAMAAGAVVVSVRVPTGPHYLDHGRNGVVADADDLPAALASISADAERLLRHRLLLGGMATASRYSLGHQRSLVDGAMGRGLREALSWS